MIVEKGIKEELRWFYEARFGMFVHFGLYSLLGRGEWVMYDENIPRAEYEKLALQFNPSEFDADEWVKVALDAGAKYIALTTKHHDGFCLFDSALTSFKITNTAFGRDLTGELIDACHRNGMRIVLYYSQPDWHHPNYVHNKGAFKDLDYPPETDRPDWDEYVRYYMGQVEELCTKYGRIDGIWFDGSHKTVEEWRGREVYDLIKKYQPHAVVNDRARYGDLFTPERSLPENLTGYLFEACESISPVAWGYRCDTPSYSAAHLVRSLDRMVVNGGNYLLNVGPDPRGIIPEKQKEVMCAIGGWLKNHGEAIYSTEPVFMNTPETRIYKKQPVSKDISSNEPSDIQTKEIKGMDGIFGATRKGNHLFAHFLHWPEIDRLILPGVGSAVKQVRLMSDGTSVPFQQDGSEVELRDLSCVPPDAFPQIFDITFESIPDIREKEVVEEEKSFIKLDAKGLTCLKACSARFEGFGVKGTKLRLETNVETGTEFIKGWWTPEQEALWNIECEDTGDYIVYISAGSSKVHGESIISISAGEIQLTVPMPGVSPEDTKRAAKASDNALQPGAGFEMVQAGTLHLSKGRHTLVVKPYKLMWGYVFGEVEKIVLKKAAS